MDAMLQTQLQRQERVSLPEGDYGASCCAHERFEESFVCLFAVLGVEQPGFCTF